MGLITETVMVGLGGNNVKWFEDKGYEIPRRVNSKGRLSIKFGTKIEIKVEDLNDCSDVFVDIKCDGCNELLNVVWKSFKKSAKEDGSYYCKKCASNLFGKDKLRLTRLKNGKSFEQWCLENNKQDILDRWDYELNIDNPNYIISGTTKKYYFKCPRGIHKSELKDLHSFTQGNTSLICLKCDTFAQWGIDNLGEDFLEKYWDYEKNNEFGIDPWMLTWGSYQKVWIKCQEKDYHGSYPIPCGKFSSKETSRGFGCPYCRSNIVHILDSIGTLYPHVFDVWSDKNKDSPYNYTFGTHKKVWWKCENSIHNDFIRGVQGSLVSELRCPDCVRERQESFLQEKVRLYIETLGHTIFHEHKCTIIPINPKTKMPMPFDNEIVELKLIIEVMGSQHYTIGKWCKTEEDLHKRKLYDRYKRAKAKHEGYHYLEIPYGTDNKSEDYKKLIDNKISQIIST